MKPKTQTRIFTGRGWTFPIRLSPSGGLSYSSGEQDIQEAIWIILSTARGERQMRPRFGCGIHDLVFAPLNATTIGDAGDRVRQALTEFEPRIDVMDVRVTQAPGELNKLLVRVDYRIRSTNAAHNIVYPFFIGEGIRV